MNNKIKIGISHGDANGIGYEVILKTFSDARVLEFCTPIIYGSSKVAAYYRKTLNISNLSLNNINKAEDAHPKRVNIINCTNDDLHVEPGKITQEAGKAAFDALERATADIKTRKINILLTAPIHKHNIQSESFNFPGHTEYLQNKFESRGTLMILCSDTMRIGVATGHIPISQVSETLTPELIYSKIQLMNQSLTNDFQIRKPKIAVLGLNPHAGDMGLIGTEEQEIITPAIERAYANGVMAFGPYAADGFFGSDQLGKYDGILAMYHDQGLAPFKALSFGAGVNFTAGLPIVRTSPDHGTAFEISGTNKAIPDSFRTALYTAIDIFKNRSLNREIKKNPLQKVDINKIDNIIDEKVPSEHQSKE